MSPFTVVVRAEDVGPSLRLRDELHAKGVSCVVLAEPGGGAAGIQVPACAALVAAGIAVLLFAGPAFPPSLLDDLRRRLPRVAEARSSVEATVDDLGRRGWILTGGEVYTEDELETVTARLRELGYA